MAIDVSPRLIRAFLALAECRHFTRAAERCHVSQSAFSGMIRRLEEAIGTRLFERNTRNVTLTAEGDLFAEAAQRLLAEFETAFLNLREHVARRKGRVGVAALPSLAAGWLPPILAAYRRRYPGITVELFDALSDRCLDLVREGRADLALTAPGEHLAEFDVRPLCSDRFFLVCHRDHPLAARTSVTLAELAGCELIHLARSTSVRQHLEAGLRAAGLPGGGFEVEHLATVAGLIAAGLGVSLVPKLTLFQFRHPELRAVPVEEAQLVRPILIVRRRARSLPVAAQAMLDLLEARVASDPGLAPTG
jgi:DNA-binding transcriptional LysR family regulator